VLEISLDVNKQIFLDVNSWTRHTAVLHGFAKLYAVYGGIAILIIILVLAYITGLFGHNRLNNSTNAFLTGAAVLFALGVGQIVSHIVKEPRPWQSLHGIELLIGSQHDYSFPSDHATFAGAIITGLLIGKRYWFGLAALIFGLALAFFRIYVGAHYPGDVLGGLALGALSGVFVFWAARRPIYLLFKQLCKTPLKVFFIGLNDK
jgi:membrane-associated phospholipid phosphatase